MKPISFSLGSLFRSQITTEKVYGIYVKNVDAFLVQERDFSIASSRMHHTSLLVAGMMQEEYKLKKLQFEIALDKVIKTYPSSISKENIGRAADEINAKLILILPYPIKDEVLDKIREVLLAVR